jgi:hypothetical protein
MAATCVSSFLWPYSQSSLNISTDISLPWWILERLLHTPWFQRRPLPWSIRILYWCGSPYPEERVSQFEVGPVPASVGTTGNVSTTDSSHLVYIINKWLGCFWTHQVKPIVVGYMQ